ncbi:hypothetical protein AAC387_Pa10g0737 [Persea americana]
MDSKLYILVEYDMESDGHGPRVATSSFAQEKMQERLLKYEMEKKKRGQVRIPRFLSFPSPNLRFLFTPTQPPFLLFSVFLVFEA